MKNTFKRVFIPLKKVYPVRKDFFNALKGQNSLRGFTLIELLLTVMILSVGIIFVLKSYLLLSEAINLAENKIQAITYLDRQMDTLRFKGIKEDISQLDLENEVTLNNRTFSLSSEVQPIYEQTEGEEERVEIEAIKEITLIINWFEGSKQREERLISYVRSSEKEQTE